MTIKTVVKFSPIVVALLVAACTFPSRAPTHPNESAYRSQTGIASWYGPNLHGRTTADGETFDQDALSAAHRTWPMPSFVRVTNLENGRQVVVRLNDRGPFSEDRIIDLSRAAARVLGIEEVGQARVRINYLGPAPAAASAPDTGH